MNVYLQEPANYSDMQGPCYEGYHIPLKSEWEGVITIMTGLSLSTQDDWKTYLHMPYAGSRFGNPPSVQGVNGYYLTSDTGNNNNYTFTLTMGENTAPLSGNNVIYGGYSIRPFKNKYVTPNSSWTVIQGTLGNAGIFWDTVNGIISITSNGTTGYTIADKNLGATTVYNSGNTLSEANCGKYYQFGNNYGFAWARNVQTSNTQIDASAYGPGNYYSSSTLVVASGGWDSSHNKNLRGGVSGLGGMTELKNDYIGEYKNRWELSTDFRNYTSLVQLQALGWTGIVNDGSYSIGSFGIKQTTTNKYTRIYVNLPIKLTTNNKITIEYTGNSASNAYLAGRASGQINNSTEPDGGLCAMNMFGTTGGEQGILGGQDGWIIRGGKNGSGDFSVKGTFDLSTGKVTYSQTLPSGIAYSNTGTMSNRAIQDALNFGICAFAIQDYGSGNSICLYTASIIIE